MSDDDRYAVSGCMIMIYCRNTVEPVAVPRLWKIREGILEHQDFARFTSIGLQISHAI